MNDETLRLYEERIAMLRKTATRFAVAAFIEALCIVALVTNLISR